MEKYQKIIIDLPNGDKLVAEECPYDIGQISVGIADKHGNWVQDLVVVETNETDKFNIYVYNDEYDEGYTHKYTVNRCPDITL